MHSDALTGSRYYSLACFQPPFSKSNRRGSSRFHENSRYLHEQLWLFRLSLLFGDTLLIFLLEAHLRIPVVKYAHLMLAKQRRNRYNGMKRLFLLYAKPEESSLTSTGGPTPWMSVSQWS